jgi:putative ABC transport system permease protein
MLMLKIAFRNIFRNARRSVATLSTIAIGATAILVFGAYVTYIALGVQTGAVQSNGHLQVFKNGYFTYGSGAPAAWGIHDYQAVLSTLQSDPVLKPLVAVMTPIQALAGIAGNFIKDTSKPFLGRGFVPSDRDRMKQWNEYGTGSQGLKRSGMHDDEASIGIAGEGLMRILGLCDELHLENCPPALPQNASASAAADAASDPSLNVTELAQRDAATRSASTADAVPSIELLSATAAGAPNVVSLSVARVERQTVKELDDNYVGLNLSLAQQLVYGRGEHQATGIVIQLHRSEDLAAVRAHLSSVFKRLGLDLEMRDFTELTPQYNQIINLFGSIFTFITVVMAIVVMFTVSNAMGMSVIERTDEIGTTRAMGVRRSGIRLQFLLEGSLLGVVGSTAGVVVAHLVAYLINHAGLTWTPPGSPGPIPLRVYMEGAWLLSAGTWLGLTLVAAVAAFIPAGRGARMVVVDALRHV